MADKKINYEYALQDTKHIICKYLPFKDLQSIAKVDKSWRHAAMNEAGKRGYIQQSVLPFDLNFSELESPGVASLLTNFSTAVIFHDSKLPRFRGRYENSVNPKENPDNYLLEKLKKELPRKTIIVVHANKFLSSETSEIPDSKDKDDKNLRPNHDILGLFFPRFNKPGHFDMAWVSNCECASATSWFSKHYTKNPNDRPKSTLLLFVGSRKGYDLARRFVKKLQTSVHKREAVWIGMCENKLTAFTRSHECDDRKPRMMAMRITSPAVDSWTTVINVFLPKEKIEEKLRELKDNVIPRQYFTGLIYAPFPHCNCNEVMTSLKSIFPDVPFTGFFNREGSLHINKKFASYLDHNIKLSLFDKINGMGRYMSIIVIAYD